MNVCAVFGHQGKRPAKRGFEKNSKIIVQTSAHLTPGAGPTTSSWCPWTQCFAVVTSGRPTELPSKFPKTISQQRAPRPVRGTTTPCQGHPPICNHLHTESFSCLKSEVLSPIAFKFFIKLKLTSLEKAH